MGSTNLPRSGDDPTAERRKERPVADIDKATILITDATDGLGRRIARHLPASAATILLVARPRREARRDHGARDREKTNNEKLRYYLANLSSLDEVRRLAEEVRADYDRLVILINNARVFVRERAISRDGHELTFAVNYLAPFLLTHLLVPLLRCSAPARATTTSLRRAKAR